MASVRDTTIKAGGSTPAMSTTPDAAPTLLGIPGEIRNLIYDHVAADCTWVANPKNPALPGMAARELRFDDNVSEPVYGVRPHPLTAVCHQTRSEFSSLLRNGTTGSSDRIAFVEDFKFQRLLDHLKAHPSLHQAPCELTVCMSLTKRYKRSDEDGLMEWVTECKPQSAGPSMNVTHLIHGKAYRVFFRPCPRPPGGVSRKWNTSFHRVGRLMVDLRNEDRDAYAQMVNMLRRIFDAMSAWSFISEVPREFEIELRGSSYQHFRLRHHQQALEHQIEPHERGGETARQSELKRSFSSTAPSLINHHTIAVPKSLVSAGAGISSNTISSSRTDRKIALPRKLNGAGPSTSETSPTLLGLPRKLRNLIYNCVAADFHWLQNPKNELVPCATTIPPTLQHTLNGKRGTTSPFAITSHPFTMVCRQVRTEFSEQTRNHSSGTSPRIAHVIDNNFEYLLRQLQSYPSFQTPCELIVYLDFTKPIAEDSLSFHNWVEHWQPFGKWVEACKPLYAAEGEPCHFLIHDKVYNITFRLHLGFPHRWKDAFLGKISKDINACRRLATKSDYWSRKHKHNHGDKIPILSRMELCLRSWVTSSGAERHTDSFKHRRNRGLAANVGIKRKRYAEPDKRQEKRQKLCEEGEWTIEEGFDIYGDKDEDYEQLIESLKAWML